MNAHMKGSSPGPLDVLALSGSLRTGSINTALLRAASRLAPPEISVTVWDGLGRLPLFNPDLDPEPPTAVSAFRERVARAEALLIASPEYAHGVTGPLKNALDWLVSFEPFAYKPVAVLNASPRSRHADESLREILRTMSAFVVEPASIAIPLLGSQLDERGIAATPQAAAPIQEALSALHEAVVLHRRSASAGFRLE